MKTNIKDIVKIISIFLIIFVYSICGNAQISFKINGNSFLSDLTVSISDKILFPDISIKIGEEVFFENFTVGITANKNQADFIITDSTFADVIIKISESVLLADLSIKAGKAVLLPDVTIKIKKTGVVDYAIYSEKEYITLQELVIALLPAINQELNYKFDNIPLFIKGNNQKSTTSDSVYDIILILKGASIFAQDSKQTYLGKIENSYNLESIFNEYGMYGSEYSSKSIWNEYSTFGNEYNLYSPFNEYSASPPIIVKNGKIIGYLTTNNYIKGGISPHILKGLEKYF
jgi:hypothetical protein